LNIDISIGAQISKVQGAVTVKEGVIKRTVVVTLAREFDMPLAAALGKDAKKALDMLESGSLAEVTIPMDRIEATAVFRASGEAVKIIGLRGISCKAKAGDPDEDEPPTAKLTFEFDWAKDAWVFLGWNLSAMAEVEIASTQADMFAGEAA
jgi:hypothetical protein